jgi:hypothetical protein
VFSLGLVDENSHVTQFVLENPPPFSRIARTAEKAVPIKGLADKADDFQQLLTNEGISGYYNDAIYEYQQLYIGDSGSYEESFMTDVYTELTDESKLFLNAEYFNYFGEELTGSHYVGISRVLIEETTEDNLVYQQLLELEATFSEEFEAQKLIKDAYDDAVSSYDQDVLNYAYYSAYSDYEDSMEAFIAYNISYLEAKITAAENSQPFTDEFTMTLPTLDATMPDNYEEVSTAPTVPVETQEIIDATNFVEQFSDKTDVRDLITEFGENFESHKGLLMWYVDELDRDMASTAEGGEISDVIVSYKTYYDTIIENIDDEELESKLYLAQMSVTTYDVFSTWLTCTQEHIDSVALEDLSLEVNRCSDLDPSQVTDYDFTGEAFDIITTLFEGESVSWIILQYKYDYEAGVFDTYFEEFEEVQGVLESTKSLVDEYDAYYKDIANSIEGNVSMVIKIGISVMKYNFDIYETLEDTPMLAAMFNDSVNLCSNEERSTLDIDVTVCNQTTGDGGFKELLNMRYLASEILFKAYIMVDDENEPIIYDYEKMEEFLDKANEAVDNHVLNAETVEMFGDQFAFNVIDEETNYTLLEQMYDDGQITVEAMRLLADDEHELFSEEFRIRVRSLIR